VATIRAASSQSVTLAALSASDPFGVSRPALWRGALPAAGAQGAMDATVGLAAGSAAGALHRRQPAGLAFSPAALVFGVGEGHQAVMGWMMVPPVKWMRMQPPMVQPKARL
jgi:hypothetical protein